MRGTGIVCLWLGTSAACFAALGVERAPEVEAEAGGPSGIDSRQPPIQEVVVTAERRTSTVQITPMAITAVTGDTLQEQQITDIQSLSNQLPNVEFSRSGGDARVFIRGIGLDSITPGSDPRVAIYTDGGYNPRAQAALGSFYDIERVEVLSGPQGTLYGRNATAGAINIISRDPGPSLNGYGKLTVGDYSTVRAEGAVGGPLSERIGGRVAFQTSDQSGFGTNIVTGGAVDDVRTRAGRLKVRVAADPLTATIQGDYFLENDHTGGYHYLGEAPGKALFASTIGGATPANYRDFAGPGPQTRVEGYGPTGTLQMALGGLTLTSISAYKHLRADTYTSPDGSTLAARLLPLDIVEESDSVSEELRLGGKIGPIDLVFGAFYFHEKNFAGNDAGVNTLYFTRGAVDFLAAGAVNRGTQKTDAYAVFTQNTINITEDLGVDVGGRYSNETRSDTTTNVFDLTTPYSRFPEFAPDPLEVTVSGKRSWDSFDPKIGVHYRASKDLFLYASYSTGFKTGGFNVAFIQPPFNPERIKDVEAGIKMELFGHRARMNLAGFHYAYDNLQVNLVGGPSGTQLITENAAKATLYGAELNLTALPVRALEINIDANYLHSQFDRYSTKDPAGLFTGQPLPDGTRANPDDSYNLSGHALTYAPEWKLHGRLSYTFNVRDLDITPRADATYTGQVYHSAFKLPYVSQPSFTLLDVYLDLDLPRSGFSANLFVKNTTNQFYRVSSTIGSAFIGYPLEGLVGAPRTFGASVTKRF